jgi:hypothetical protein
MHVHRSITPSKILLMMILSQPLRADILQTPSLTNLSSIAIPLQMGSFVSTALLPVALNLGQNLIKHHMSTTISLMNVGILIQELRKQSTLRMLASCSVLKPKGLQTLLWRLCHGRQCVHRRIYRSISKSFGSFVLQEHHPALLIILNGIDS